MLQTSQQQELWQKLGRLDAVQQRTVSAFIDSLLVSRSSATKPDKSDLLKASVWSEEDIQHIADVQEKINEWQLPAYCVHLRLFTEQSLDTNRSDTIYDEFAVQQESRKP